MAGVRELLRIWGRRTWRRRWLCLAVSWAVWTPGWTMVNLLGPHRDAATALLLIVLLLIGAAAGGVAAALVAGRTPAFDSVAELQCAFDRPVLGEVADLTPRSWRWASSDVPFALACLALIAMFGGLLLAQAPS
jgi:hypothetical protein